LKGGLAFSGFEWVVMIVGTVVSFIVAYVVIAFFMNYLKKRKLAPFAYYRIILGILVLILL
ncbi:MAG: undecaprenyl-diphosphatase, partial [Caloramator sp.]|nr:undecaprenyl-diphosphatase [Caloramator sp.]